VWDRDGEVRRPVELPNPIENAPKPSRYSWRPHEIVCGRGVTCAAIRGSRIPCCVGVLTGRRGDCDAELALAAYAIVARLSAIPVGASGRQGQPHHVAKALANREVLWAGIRLTPLGFSYRHFAAGFVIVKVNAECIGTIAVGLTAFAIERGATTLILAEGCPPVHLRGRHNSAVVVLMRSDTCSRDVDRERARMLCASRRSGQTDDVSSPCAAVIVPPPQPPVVLIVRRRRKTIRPAATCR